MLFFFSFIPFHSYDSLCHTFSFLYILFFSFSLFRQMVDFPIGYCVLSIHNLLLSLRFVWMVFISCSCHLQIVVIACYMCLYWCVTCECWFILVFFLFLFRSRSSTEQMGILQFFIYCWIYIITWKGVMLKIKVIFSDPHCWRMGCGLRKLMTVYKLPMRSLYMDQCCQPEGMEGKDHLKLNSIHQIRFIFFFSFHFLTFFLSRLRYRRLRVLPQNNK